jgi:hypothetical protein
VNTVTIEVVGYQDSECSPFPCDEDRTCGLFACVPSGKLVPATEALRAKLKEEFQDQVTVQITLLDDGVPDYIRKIYEIDHPAIPMIIINKKILPLGRVSWQHIHDAVKKILVP